MVRKTLGRIAVGLGFILSVAVGLHLVAPVQSFAQDFVQDAKSRPSFTKRTIFLGKKKLVVEVADTDERRAYGLMFKKKIDDSEGMLFVFDDEDRRGFWMKNTLVPLSIAYFGADRVLKEIIDMQPAVMGATQPKTYRSKAKAKYALEVSIGWYQRMKIRPGEKLRFADN